MQKLKNKRVVVLGASGRIGFSLCERLAPDNEVIGVARFTDEDRARALNQMGVETIPLDLAAEDLDALPDDVDWLFIEVAYQHGAEQHPELAEALNVHLPARALMYFRNVQGVVFASTGNVYGLPGRVITEEDREAPIGVYGLTRYAGEQVVKFFCREFNIPTVILRYFYGNNEHYGIIKKIATTLQAGELPPIWMGAQINCIAHEELVERTLRAAPHAAVPAFVMNLTSSNPYPLSTIIQYIARELDITPPPLNHIEERERMTLAALTPIQDRLFGPTEISLEQIVKRVCKPLRKSKSIKA